MDRKTAKAFKDYSASQGVPVRTPAAKDAGYQARHAADATATDVGHDPKHARRPAPRAATKLASKPGTRNPMLQMRDATW